MFEFWEMWMVFWCFGVRGCFGVRVVFLRATHLVCDPRTNEHCASSRVSETARSQNSESCNNGPGPGLRSKVGTIQENISFKFQPVSDLESKSSDDISWKQSRVRKINALQWLGSSYIWCFYIFHWMIQTSFTGVLSVLQHLLWHCVSNFSIPIPRVRIPCFNMFGLYPRMPEVRLASWLKLEEKEREIGLPRK